IVMFPNLLTFAGVVLNILLNVILVFGFGPIPSLGVAGLAIASFAVRYFMGIVLLIYCCRIMRFSNYSEPGYYKQLIKIGLPISAAILVEFVTFNSVAVVMGRVAGVYAAAQNLICTLSTASFMVPFAISNAIAVKVGFANGAENYEDLKKYAKVGVIMCIIFMLCCAVVFAGFPKAIVSLFTPDRELIAICVPIIYILAAFLVFDGLQVALSGICKGIKKTSIVLKANFFAYWIVSIPMGLVLAFKFNMGLIGFWIGLLFSATILCSIMMVLLNRYFKKVKQGIVI
ncbi:MAG: MATE family efflux transporter, partial [Alphaproteobacteria bacterium]|nr:MATE family efflux transporter [Alphaproteobacteria bacterium]